jgi:hypothetical protein
MDILDQGIRCHYLSRAVRRLPDGCVVSDARIERARTAWGEATVDVGLQALNEPKLSHVANAQIVSRRRLFGHARMVRQPAPDCIVGKQLYLIVDDQSRPTSDTREHGHAHRGLV